MKIPTTEQVAAGIAAVALAGVETEEQVAAVTGVTAAKELGADSGWPVGAFVRGVMLGLAIEEAASTPAAPQAPVSPPAPTAGASAAAKEPVTKD
ncbi:MAG TPA: hypothetical protein VNJ12_11225 [Candidatus Dormibacteraeota bacterium]|nr:hypothetical protein [Candidatus Dormibacteraeota bacterium]